MRYNINGLIDEGEVNDAMLDHNNLILSNAWLSYYGLVTDMGYGYHRGMGHLVCRVVQDAVATPWPDKPQVTVPRHAGRAVICQDEHGSLWIRSCTPDGQYDFVPVNDEGGACWELHAASLQNYTQKATVQVIN